MRLSYYKVMHNGEVGWCHGAYMRVTGHASPWVMVDSPREGATASNPVAIKFSAGGGVTNVVLEADGEPLHNGQLDASAGTFTHDFADLGEEHRRVVTGYDSEGEALTTFEVSFTPVDGPVRVFPIDLNRPGLTLSRYESSSSTGKTARKTSVSIRSICRCTKNDSTARSGSTARCRASMCYDGSIRRSLSWLSWVCLPAPIVRGGGALSQHKFSRECTSHENYTSSLCHVLGPGRLRHGPATHHR